MNATLAAGIVVIGRNEATRLGACFASLPESATTVFVDSASTDDSVAIARAARVEVVQLTVDLNLSASLARNHGIRALARAAVPPTYIQTIDGDCTLCADWLAVAVALLDANPRIAVVAGRLRERSPDRSVYNRLCDDEWNVPEGESDECGGVALWRREAICDVGLFDETLSMGEEPELCHRLRRAGWLIWRLRLEMGTHDAAIVHFSAWWRRTYRSGYAVAQLAHRYRDAGEPRWRRELRRVFLWAAILPLLALIAVTFVNGWLGLATLAGWVLLLVRMALRSHRAGHPWRWAIIASVFNLLGKFAQLGGALRFHRDRFAQRTNRRYRYDK